MLICKTYFSKIQSDPNSDHTITVYAIKKRTFRDPNSYPGETDPYVVYNLVGAFLGLATMLRGESLSAGVNSQCTEKSVKMCRTCVRCVGMETLLNVFVQASN